MLGSGLSGTTIEFYDFFIYGTAAALMFPSLFFPNLSPLMALLVSFLTLSITFVSRPIGAIDLATMAIRSAAKNRWFCR